MLGDHRFWIGMLVGAILYYAYLMRKAKQAK